MKNTLLLFVVLAVASCTQKTTDKNHIATNDSVKKYLNLANDDNLEFDKRIVYNDKAYSFIDTIRNDSVTRNDLYKVCINYNQNWEFTKIKSPSNKLLNLSIIANDSINIGNAYSRLGVYYMMDSKNEKALECFFKAKKIFSNLHLIDKELKVTRNIGLTQSYVNDYLGSLKTYFEILKKAKKNNLKNIENSVYPEIANTLTYMKKYEKAIEYFLKSTLSNHRSVYIINNNIALTYLDYNNPSKAIVYLNKNILNTYIYDYNNLAVNRSLFGYYYLQINDIKKAYFYLKKAEKEFTQIEDTGGTNYNQIYLSQYYEKVKDTTKAIEYAEKAVQTSKKYKNQNDILLSLTQLIKIDTKNASAHAQEYIKINEEMQTMERNFRDKYAQIAYETEEIKEQKDSAVKKQFIFAGLSAGLLFIGILLFIIIKQRSNRIKLQLEQEQQKANEEIYELLLSQKNNEEQARQQEKKRIALDLHDGVMNKLASVRLNLNVLSHQKDEKTIDNCLLHIDTIYTIEQEIRTIAHDLNQDVFSLPNSFIKLLEEFIETQNETYTTVYSLKVETIDWTTISSVIKMNLYRIIQESCHNISKHAAAKTAIINIVLDENNICISIYDDGIGFVTSTLKLGIGLQNITQRVEKLHGKFVLNSLNQSGTSLNISIPV